MIVKLNGATIRFWWSYCTTTSNNAGGSVKGADETTVWCELSNGTEYRCSVVRNHADVPNRPVARRKALHKLMLGFFSREERRIIWQAYFAEHRDLRLRPAKVKTAPVAGVGGPQGGAA